MTEQNPGSDPQHQQHAAPSPPPPSASPAPDQQPGYGAQPGAQPPPYQQAPQQPYAQQPQQPQYAQQPPYAQPAPPPHSGVGQPADLMNRFLAKLIDGIILLIVYLIFNSIFRELFAPSVNDILTGRASAFSGGIWLAGALTAVVTAVIYLAYFALMESNRGQTLGKMLLKLKTLGPNGGNPTMEQAIKRNIWVAAGVLGIVPLAGAFLGGVAGIVAVIAIAVTINGNTATRQGWHDKFAGGTSVIKIG